MPDFTLSTLAAYILVALLSVYNAFASSSFVTFDQQLTQTTYDYVIVGGGESSLAFASAKSLAQPSAKILIVEAGGDTREDSLVKYATNYTFPFNNPLYDWCYNTTVQDVGKQPHTIHVGASLGGSSTINDGVYVLPPLSQLDTLFKELGEASFGGKELFEHIRKTQNFIEPTKAQVTEGLTSDTSAHSTGGPITVGYSNSLQVTDNENAFIKTQKDVLKADKLIDIADGGENKIGSAWYPKTILPDSGAGLTRVSAATAFVSGQNRMSNGVSILLHTRAIKMQYANTNARPLQASMVDLQQSKGGTTISVNAAKVIVGAGVIGSPAFLERSGIGSKSVLSAANVQTLIELGGVGTNLQDHVQAVPVVGQTLKKASGLDFHQGSILAYNSVQQLMPNSSDVQAHIEQNMAGWAQDVVSAGGSASVNGLLAQYKAIAQGIFTKQWPAGKVLYGLTETKNLFINVVALPFSRGYTHITSTSAWAAPQINTRFFTTPIDMDVSVAMARAGRTMVHSNDMASILTSPFNGEWFPGFDVKKGGVGESVDENQYREWADIIAVAHDSIGHAVGTCAMMSETNGGVVDGGFKVHQTSNVYVIGSAVVPLIHTGFPVSVLYGLAYAAASVIS